MEDKQLTIGEVTYNFPANHVFGFTNPGEGHPFARIRPPGQKYDLVYSEFSKYRRNFQGDGTPLVTSVNDFSSDKFHQFQFANGTTVCREGLPFYTCGLQVIDNSVTWSVIFNKEEVKNSEAIRASAIEALRAYRR